MTGLFSGKRMLLLVAALAAVAVLAACSSDGDEDSAPAALEWSHLGCLASGWTIRRNGRPVGDGIRIFKGSIKSHGREPHKLGSDPHLDR